MKRSYIALLLLAFFQVFSYFVLSLSSDAWYTIHTDVLIDHGALYGPLVWHGEWYRMILYMFLSKSVIQCVFNLALLVSAWHIALYVFSSRTLLGILITGGFVAGWISSTLNLTIISTGILPGVMAIWFSLFGWIQTHKEHYKKLPVNLMPYISLAIIFLILSTCVPNAKLDTPALLASSFTGFFLGAFLPNQLSTIRWYYGLCIWLVIISVIGLTLNFSVAPNKHVLSQLQQQEAIRSTIRIIQARDQLVEMNIRLLWDKPHDSSWSKKWDEDVINLLNLNIELSGTWYVPKSDPYAKYLSLIREYAYVRLKEAQTLKKHHNPNTPQGVVVNNLRTRVENLNKALSGTDAWTQGVVKQDIRVLESK